MDSAVQASCNSTAQENTYHLSNIAGMWCLAMDWNFLTNTSNILINISLPYDAINEIQLWYVQVSY